MADGQSATGESVEEIQGMGTEGNRRDGQNLKLE